MKVLVTGGAGYIGSFMAKALLDKAHEVVIVDSLERGHEENLNPKAKFVNLNLLDKAKLSSLFKQNSFEAIIHFAGYISMGESMENPSIYFNNNSLGSLNLMDCAVESNVSKFIFSSTAGVYGNPEKTPIAEDHPKNPTNPYGESKLIVERMLSWYQKIHNLSFVSLRYFNAAGASDDATMGERHDPETHLIPNAIKAVLENKEFMLFGNDYNTEDGTCVRDYIHVEDLVGAHLLSLEKLQVKKGGYYYNVGTGRGYSIKQVLSTIEDVAGQKIKVSISPRRPGDAEILVADISKIRSDLNFTPEKSDIKTIVKTAFAWHKQQYK